MKKRILSMLMVMVMLTGVFALTGCGGTEEAAEEETLVVGLDDTFAPMGFRDENGDLVGFDIDLANAVGEEMGVTVEFKPIDWDAKEIELKSGTIDCVWNGMSVTPERMESMALTDKYLNNKIVLMALADSDTEVTEASQLADLKIGTQADSSALEMLKANEEYEAFKANISEYDTYDAAIMDLKAGRVDVIAVDQVLGEYTNNNLGGTMKECEYSLGDDYYVIGCAKENTELRDKLNEAVKTLVDNGKAAEISEKWFGKDIVVFEPLEDKFLEVQIMDKIMEFMPFMLEGSIVTIELFVLTLVLSLPLGLPVALGSNSRIKPLSFICKVYVWIFRGTPLLLQLFFFYFFFPLVLNVQLDVFFTVVLTYVLNYAAYFAEIYRGGINSIDRGQYEAAHALGLTKRQTMIDIVLPQTMKAILPPVVNEAITLVKDTALASTLPVIELMKATNSAVNRMTDMTPFFFAAIIYLIMTFVLTIIAGRLEKYFSRYDAREEW